MVINYEFASLHRVTVLIRSNYQVAVDPYAGYNGLTGFWQCVLALATTFQEAYTPS